MLNIPLDQAEILVTEKEADGKVLKSFAKEDFAGHLQITRIERAGEPIPLGTDTELKRFDVMYVAGLKGTIDKVAAKLGKIARPSTSTDLLTLSAGMVLGLLIGKITVPVGDFSVGLGNAGGLLLSGILVSSLVSRLRFFGSTPNAARNILEDLGLVTFIAIVGINAGATLLEQLTGAIALKIFLAGFVASTIPPFITWAIGLYVFKINPAVLMGGVAGSRSHSGPAREAAKEIGTSVPWVGFPVGLCGLRRALHGVRLLRDVAVAMTGARGGGLTGPDCNAGPVVVRHPATRAGGCNERIQVRHNRKHSPGIAHPAPVLGATLFALCGVAMAQQPETRPRQRLRDDAPPAPAAPTPRSRRRNLTSRKQAHRPRRRAPPLQRPRRRLASADGKAHLDRTGPEPAGRKLRAAHASEWVDETRRKAWEDTKWDVQFRTYYLDRDKYDDSQSEAWAIGGSVGLKTGYFRERIRFGATAYTSISAARPGRQGRHPAAQARPAQLRGARRDVRRIPAHARTRA